MRTGFRGQQREPVVHDEHAERDAGQHPRLFAAADSVPQLTEPVRQPCDVGTVAGAGGDNTDGLAVDPESGTAAAPEVSGIGLYDLGTGSGTFITPGGSVYQHPADDPGAREYLVEEMAPPGAEGAGPTRDNNSISAELVISPAGLVLKRIEKFQFFNVLTLIGAATTQLNPAVHTAYTLGLDATQLEPFSY
jgi:hypothetical protein